MTPSRPSNPHGLRASGDRWLFGYADVVTLLLACFACLYATRLTPAEASEPEPAPAEVTARSAEVATEASETETMEAAVEAHAPTLLETAVAEIVGNAGSLPGVETTTSARGLVISLPEAGSFAPGRADLSPEASIVMYELAGRLRDLPNLIRVEGHTDDVPIATSQFASNWDLSTARATRVIEFLIEEAGIDPMRLAAAGYAEHRPRVPNDTAERRARNRRVDIVVLDPEVAGTEEPGSPAR
jgi:chemotaxis protein MotB